MSFFVCESSKGEQQFGFDQFDQFLQELLFNPLNHNRVLILLHYNNRVFHIVEIRMIQKKLHKLKQKETKRA